MKTLTCKNCRGLKKMRTIGHMFVRCNTCHGLGTVPVKDTNEFTPDPLPPSTVAEPTLEPPPEPTKKKRGRPKKVKDHG